MSVMYLNKATAGAGSYDLDSLSDPIHPQSAATGDYSGSCVKLTSGAILVMYSRGTSPGAIYQATVADLATLLGGDDTISSETAVFSNLYYPKATVFRGPDEELYCIISYTKTTTVNTAKVEVYHSALGDGSDWTLHGTICSISWGGGSSVGSSFTNPLGIPRFEGSTWILPYTRYYNYSGYLSCYNSIATSEDGITWTVRFSAGIGSANNSTQEGSRNIGKVDGDFWWCWYGNLATNTRHYIKSTDNEIWTDVFQETQAIDMQATIFEAGLTLQLVEYAGNRRYSEISPAAYTDFQEAATDMPQSSPYAGAFEIDGTFIYMYENGGITLVYAIGTTAPTLERVR